MKQADIVIIGSGVLGYSTAISLLEENKNLRILMIGNKDKRGGATQAAGAMLGCFGEITEAYQKSEFGRTKIQCSINAKKMWDPWIEFIREKSGSNIQINRGTFIVHNNSSGSLDTKNLRAIKKALQENKEAYYEVNFEDIPGVNTLENLRSLEALFIPNEGNVCAASFLENLHRAASTYKNFTLIQEEVTDIKVNNTKIQNVKLSNNEIIVTPLLILAAGAFTQTILDKLPDLSKKIPRILSGVGHALLVEQGHSPITNVIRTPNRAGACGLHVLPYDGYLYVGATNEIKLSPEDSPTVGWVHFLMQCLLDQINQNLFQNKLVKILVGNRPSPMDGFPLLGATSISNLFLLTGTYRDGFHQSPYLAKLITRNILYNESILNNFFQPERKPIQTMSHEEAVNEAVEHQMASAYEAGAKLPHAFWSEAMKKHIKNDILNFYEQLGVTCNLLPEHTLMLRDHCTNEKFISSFKSLFIQ